MTSVYTESERTVMAQLPVKEQTILHALKALTDGEIQERKPDAPLASVAPEIQEGDKSAAPKVEFLDPSEIPFGPSDTPKSKKRRPIYAVVWTFKKHRVHKTKARCQRKQRAWKKWHERNGWKVSSHAAGYFASKGNLRAAITLHEYDAETRQRIA